MIAAGFNEHAKILNEGDLVEILLPGGGDWLLGEVRHVYPEILGHSGWEAHVVALNGLPIFSLISSIESDDAVKWRPSPLKKCLVEGCSNRSDQGEFRGSVCLPCANFLAGRGDEAHSSQAYRNSVKFARAAHLKAAAADFDAVVSSVSDGK